MSTADLRFQTREVRGGYQGRISQKHWGGNEFVCSARGSRSKAERDAFKVALYTYRRWMR